jgi:hypothetical protein
MIRNTNELYEDKTQRQLTLAYTIENIINGLKYINNEWEVEGPMWETLRKRIETIDLNVDRIIEIMETKKEKSK